MHPAIRTRAARAAIAAVFAFPALQARADVITDWNTRAGDIMVEAKLGTPPAIRAMALVQTAVYDAVNAITQRYPTPRGRIDGANGASVDAAIAAANRATLVKLLPAQQAAIDAAYHKALDAIAEGPAKMAGIVVGEQAAAAIFAERAHDTVTATDDYRPFAAAGSYVPTMVPAVPHWSRRMPWLMPSADALRPAAPPALSSEAWARDFNEVRAVGGKSSAARSPEQTEVARFWEYSLPPIYHGVVRSVASQPGRDVTRNARLMAAVAQAMDDAMISVFDAKYHHNFWRPVTAIRNGDLDGNEATSREPSWAPLVEAPMHPEYPSGHAILAGSVAAVLKAEVGAEPMPVLATSSPTAKGATRRWSSVEDFVQEVSNARVYAGIHYRTATDVGADMGRRIGLLAAERHFAPRIVTSAMKP